MPPKYPNRLVKPPTHMNRPEMAVLVALGVSVSIGFYHMGRSTMQMNRGGGSDASRDRPEGRK